MRSFALALAVSSAAASAGCHAHTGQSAPPTTAAGAGNSPNAPLKTFRLTASGGIGFDDLLFSPELRAVLAPPLMYEYPFAPTEE